MIHSNTNPQSGQYATHAYTHITQAVAAMDSCFGLVRPHPHGIAVGRKIGLKAPCVLPLITCWRQFSKKANIVKG